MNSRRRYHRRASRLPWMGIVIVSLMVAQASPEAAAERDQDLERCRYLHERIEHYTRLRRGGGNTVQMERWRTARQNYEREYRQRRCHRYGSRLTIRP